MLGYFHIADDEWLQTSHLPCQTANRLHRYNSCGLNFPFMFTNNFSFGDALQIEFSGIHRGSISTGILTAAEMYNSPLFCAYTYRYTAG